MMRAMKARFSSVLPTVLLLASACAIHAATPAPATIAAKRPDSAHFTLRDGTQIVGKLEIKNVEVLTVYGTLTVPLDDVVKIRVGKKSDRELKTKIDKCITDLGSKDFAARDAATVELGKLGRMAYTELRKASFSDDPEVKERANKLIEEIGVLDEDADVPCEDDEVVTPTFTIVGAVKFDSLSIATKFGPLKVAKKDLAVMSLAEPQKVSRAVSVPAKSTAGRMLATGVRVKRGDRLIINASGTVSYRNYGGTQFTPEGSSNYGAWNENFQIGSLLGRINAGGQLFKVGERYNDKIEQDGELFLGIATHDSGSTYGNGEFKVRIQIQPATP
jgi:hypothetical protein